MESADNPQELPGKARKRILRVSVVEEKELSFLVHPRKPIGIYRITESELHAISSVALRREIFILFLGGLIGVIITTSSTILLGIFPDPTIRLTFLTISVVSIVLFLLIGCFYSLAIWDSITLNKEIHNKGE